MENKIINQENIEIHLLQVTNRELKNKVESLLGIMRELQAANLKLSTELEVLRMEKKEMLRLVNEEVKQISFIKSNKKGVIDEK